MDLVIDPSSVVLFAAGSVVIALVLCVALRRHSRGDRAIRWLIASNIALFAAAMGVLTRPVIGYEAAVFLVIAGAYCGFSCAYFAVLSAEACPLPLTPIAVVGAIGVSAQVAFAALGGAVPDLMLCSSALNSVVLAVVIRHLWWQTKGYGRSIAVLIVLPFAALLLGYTLRVPLILIWQNEAVAITASVLIIVVMAWAAVMLELALIALRERQARRKLRAALSEVEAAHAARTRFLLEISHDLRTPLNAIIGCSELMRSGAVATLPDTHRLHVDLINENGQVLNALIEDLLQVASDAAPDTGTHRVVDGVRDAARRAG